MKHLVLLSFFSLFLLLSACVEEVPVPASMTGTWTGTLTAQGTTENIRLNLSQENSAVEGDMSYLEPETQTYQPFGEVSGGVTNGAATLNVASELAGFPTMTFSGEVNQNTYAGTVTFEDVDNEVTGTFNMTR